MDSLPRLLLPIDLRPAVRRGAVDVYAPDGGSRAAVLIVHGGPLPAAVQPRPRDWPLYQEYASHLADRGVVAGVVDHRLHSPADYPAAHEDVRAAVETLDADRVALWFFSGAGMLAAPWLREPPSWLRCVALTYPYLAPIEGWDVDPAFATVPPPGDLPVVLTRVGREDPFVAKTVDGFAASTIIEVPRGRHGFDFLSDEKGDEHGDDESRAAIERALGAVVAELS